METKIGNKNTICNNNSCQPVAPQPATAPTILTKHEEVAYAVGCSPIYVRLVKGNRRERNTDLAKKILEADEALTTGKAELLETVKQKFASK
jgi:hypothetical protein